MFRVLFVLIFSLLISLLGLQYYLKSVNYLFLDRVSGENFQKDSNLFSFDKETGTLIHKNTKLHTESLFSLVSVYTSSKAIYRISGEYIGFVLVDKNLYVTKKVTRIFDIDFSLLTLVGVAQREIFPFSK